VESVVGTDEIRVHPTIGGTMSLLSIAQVAERLHTTPREIGDALRNSVNAIPYVKQDGYKRIDERDLKVLNNVIQQAKRYMLRRQSLLNAKLDLVTQGKK